MHFLLIRRPEVWAPNMEPEAFERDSRDPSGYIEPYRVYCNFVGIYYKDPRVKGPWFQPNSYALVRCMELAFSGDDPPCVQRILCLGFFDCV